MSFQNWQLQPETLFAQGPVVPVIVIKDLATAVPLAKALLAGGIKVLEVTLRTPVALEAIALLAKEVPDAIVGAGTVTTPEQLQKVIEAGVQDRVRIVHGDIFQTDFSQATVLTLYLLPEINYQLRPTILKMKPGTRVVSHDFDMVEWEPDAITQTARARAMM